MDAVEALCARHSVRDFSATPVPKETIMRILEAALRSPSGGNAQPWEVFVAAGALMETIRKENREKPPASLHPPVQPAYIQERMATIRKERMQLLGLDPSNPESGKIFLEWSSRLFNAPVMVIVCMDKELKAYFDIGIFTQSICIAAQHYGVDSLVASGFIAHPSILRRELAIPESLKIIMGIGLGYPNEASIINTYRSPRRPIHEVVRYRE